MEAVKINIDNSKVMQLPDILHCFRVADLCFALSDKLGIEPEGKEEIYISAVLHDIGKSMVDKDILNKVNKLTPIEWNAIKHHAEIGGIIAANMGQKPNIVKNIINHHENFDGTGYPRRIRGSKIPLGAQIIRICDTYDALRMNRPYKRPFIHQEAIQEILHEKEKYSPRVLKAFLLLDFQRIKSINIE